MCNFAGNKWEPLPPLEDEDKDTLFKALNMAVTHTVRSELDAETEDDRKYYLEQEEKIKKLTTKLFDPNKHTPYWKPQAPKEPKWRPFKNYTEFTATFGAGVGNIIIIRRKDQQLKKMHSVITSFVEDTGVPDQLAIGGIYLNFENWFKSFDIWIPSLRKWQPFGVKE